MNQQDYEYIERKAEETLNKYIELHPEDRGLIEDNRQYVKARMIYAVVEHFILMGTGDRQPIGIIQA